MAVLNFDNKGPDLKQNNHPIFLRGLATSSSKLKYCSSRNLELTAIIPTVVISIPKVKKSYYGLSYYNKYSLNKEYGNKF